MAASHGVWAIDIGTNALKAIRMQDGDDGLEVAGFAFIEHKRVLSSGELDDQKKEQILADTLRKFLDENDIGKEQVAIAIAGQSGFARFIKLPPVEAKKIPEVVRFEAVQQIPFDINEVEWDWQLMDNPDSPDKEVGIFAIKNEVISEVLDHFTHENLRVSCVQLSPMALYNYACYDRAEELAKSSDKAVVIMDMGAENTTLVVCTRNTVWQRNIRIGGNTFTEAIADAFKLSFQKAEKVKRTAPVSKHMRQIYTAMKPVYTELGSELQRSLGFYSSSSQGRNKTFTHIIATGGGMKLQGLSKYLQQTLGATVVKPDSFKKLGVAPDVSSAKFHEHVSDFAGVYGLGIQLLGQARIQTNLLPTKLARAMAWSQKAKILSVAAGFLVLVMLLGSGRAFRERQLYEANATARREVASIVRQAQDVQSQVSQQQGRKEPLLQRARAYKDLFQYRDVVPLLNETLLRCLPNADNTPEQAELFEAFNRGDVETVMNIPRHQRKQMFITRLVIEPAQDISQRGFPDVSRDTSRRQRSAPTRTGGRGQPEMMMDDFMMDDMMMMDMAPDRRRPGVTDQTVDSKAGFVLVIEGYSPYERISELLDPTGVRDDPSRWGVITRFDNLSKFLPDKPFELYDKGDITHFRVETGRVDLQSSDMPEGIGGLKEVQRVPEEMLEGRRTTRTTGRSRTEDRITTEEVLIDPMTQEEISRTFDIYTFQDIERDPDLTERDLGRIKFNAYGDELMIERDYWFRIQAKFVWKDAPADDAPSGQQRDSFMMY